MVKHVVIYGYAAVRAERAVNFCDFQMKMYLSNTRRHVIPIIYFINFVLLFSWLLLGLTG